MSYNLNDSDDTLFDSIPLEGRTRTAKAYTKLKDGNGAEESAGTEDFEDDDTDDVFWRDQDSYEETGYIDDDPLRRRRVVTTKKQNRYTQLAITIIILLLFGYAVAYVGISNYGRAMTPPSVVAPDATSAPSSQVIWPPDGVPVVPVTNFRDPGVPLPTDGKQRYSMKDMFAGTFYANKRSLKWLPFEHDGSDGWYTTTDQHGDIYLINVAQKNKDRLLVSASDLVDPNTGHVIQTMDYEVSADVEFLLIMSNKDKLWRHSFVAKYYVYELHTGIIYPLDDLRTAEQQDFLQLVKWSPKGHKLAFVKHNNVYVVEDPTNIRDSIDQITSDGGPDTFNGVPDWVYEEEVFQGNSALWWSPDSNHLAFLKFNESLVPEYDIPKFEFDREDHSYTKLLRMRYPKAGYPNPICDAYIFSTERRGLTVLDFPQAFDPNERLVVDVTWQNAKTAMFRLTNRVQKKDIYYVTKPYKSGWRPTMVKQQNPAGHHAKGWFDNLQVMHAISDAQYISLLSWREYDHLALFNTEKSLPSVRLTEGDFDCFDGVKGFSKERGIVYFLSSENGVEGSVGVERHLYSVRIDGTDRKRLTPNNTRAAYDVEFSSSADYYTLHYLGPDVPWSKIKSTLPGKESFELMLEDNERLKDVRSKYSIPTNKYQTIPSGDPIFEEFNMQMLLPPNFNKTHKYPILFDVYGGPASQQVSAKYKADFHTVLASHPQYPTVVVRCDGRGTKGRGHKFMFTVANKLGELESTDVINAAKWVRDQPWADKNRIAVWGWSYGGFLTTKIVEKMGGNVFSTAMAVAPVTDWRFYDSVYTERYMDTPQTNAAGYDKSQIHVTAGFDTVRYFLLHGTADDNVHFQNSASLIHALNVAHKTHVKSQFFPDDDHSMQYGEGQQQLYHEIQDFLYDGWGIPRDEESRAKI